MAAGKDLSAHLPGLIFSS